jgi:hypothetical protein
MIVSIFFGRHPSAWPTGSGLSSAGQMGWTLGLFKFIVSMNMIGN